MRPEFLSLPGSNIRRALPPSLRAPHLRAVPFGPPAQVTRRPNHRPAGAPINFSGLLFFTLALRIAVHANLPQFGPAAAPSCAWLAHGLGDSGAFCASLGPSTLLRAAPSLAFGGALALAVVSACLVQALAEALGAGQRGQLAANFAYALWLPGIAACQVAAPEVVLTPAVLAGAWLLARALRLTPPGRA